MENQSRAFLEHIVRVSQPSLEPRRRAILERADRLVQGGVHLPPEAQQILESTTSIADDAEWTKNVERVVKLDEAVRQVEGEYSSQLRAQALAVAAWAGESGEPLRALDAKFRSALEPIRDGKLTEALERLREAVRSEVPSAVARREAIRASGQTLVSAARDLGVASADLETALGADLEATPLGWPTSVPAIEQASAQIADAVRERVVAAIEALRVTLTSLRDSGVDPTANLVTVEEILAQATTAQAKELPGLLAGARSVVEEPVVAIVASQLDEVRPKLVEARRLGRDPSEVFAAMNRAREALRLKIYSEALAAGQEAIDRVGQLTSDLDVAREEADSLDELLRQLAAARFPTSPYDEPVRRIRQHLEHVELEPARDLLRETLHALGGAALEHLRKRLSSLERAAGVARERGFLPDGVESKIKEVPADLEEGRFSEAGQTLAQIEVQLRDAAGPFVARRVEEIEKGFEDIPEEALVAPVRRLLADADVNLRVKEDLIGSLESLRRAEREFAAVFAAHASALVEGLEEERRALEAMGGAGDELQRQIDEVQQIFNMGDFVKASRASQEIRTRARQQQLVRSEEAVSHAKLALVELGKMGLETAALRGELEKAQEAAKEQRYAEAHKLASATQESAQRLRSSAQSILDAIAQASERWTALRQAGLSVDAYRERINEAKRAYGLLDFEAARGVLVDLLKTLERDEAAHAAQRALAEGDLLVEDCRRLAISSDRFATQLGEARSQLTSGEPALAATRAREALVSLVAHLRPVLDENLKSLEQDLEVARSAGIETPDVLSSLGEARRRLALPVPTGVAELLESARGQLVETRGFLEHAERALRRAREAFNQAELVRADVDGLKERLDRAEALLAGREFARVIDLSSGLERELISAAHQHVSKTLAAFQALLVRSRQDGIDTTLAENLLHQARTALEEGRPLEALQLASRSEGELERVELQLRVAQGSIDTIDAKLTQSDSAGIVARVAHAELAKAREALARRDFARVLEASIEASDSLAVARDGHRRAREALDSADRQVKEAMELGADVSEVVRALDSARQHFGGGEYSEATRSARDAAEHGRWAIERLYSGAIQETRALVETARATGVPDEELKAMEEPLTRADEALKTHRWGPVIVALNDTKSAAHGALDRLVASRRSAIEAAYALDAPNSPAEMDSREEVRRRVATELERHQYGPALDALAAEATRVGDRRRAELDGRVTALKDRLWIGERLGLDTTPVMELFSEARLALESRRLELVPDLVSRGESRLAELVRSRLAQKLQDVQTELVFAQEGLHVSLGSVPDDVKRVEELQVKGQAIEAAQTLLAAEEEMNRRKSVHRELLNLHYLIDAALARATERRLDTSRARALLDESIRARSADYSLALEKARESLAILQGLLRGQEPATGFWPFKRATEGT